MTTDFTLDKLLEEQKYRVLFDGKIQEHCTLETVKQNIASLFKMESQGVESLFSGKPVTLKSDLTFEGAEKFKLLFDRTGAVCLIRSMLEAENHLHEAEAQPQPAPVADEEEEQPEAASTVYTPAAPTEVPVSPYLEDVSARAQESSLRSLIPLVMALIIIAILVYIVFFKKSTVTPRTENDLIEATLVKFDNLRSVMQVALSLSLTKEISFPRDIEDIKAFMQEHAALMPQEARSQEDKFLVDAWGQEMRYEPGEGMTYTIRSAGPDRKFGSEDDLVLNNGEIETDKEPF